MDIIAVRKDEQGVTGFKLSNNKIIDTAQAIAMVESGKLEGYNVATRDGMQYIRSNPDGDATNNLDNLPVFN